MTEYVRIISWALLLSIGHAQANSWFGDKPLKSKCLGPDYAQHDYLIIGVGVGDSLENATDLALTDIGKQLRVDVKNEERLETRSANSKVRSDYSSSTNIVSDVRGLTGTKRECWDPNASNDQHVVVFSFDKRSVDAKVADWLVEQGFQVTDDTQLLAPTMMSDSAFLLRLKQLTQLAGQPLDRLALSLLFNNDAWELAVNGRRFVLLDNDLFDLIGNKVDPDVKIVSYDLASEKFELVRKLTHNQEFKFAFRKDEYRYVSVFNLLQDGRIAELLANEKVQPSKLIPADEGLNFQAYLEKGQTVVKDMYVLLFSEQPIGTHSFHRLEVNEAIGQDQYAYAVDKFLDWAQSQPVHMSIVQTTTFR